MPTYTQKQTQSAVDALNLSPEILAGLKTLLKTATNTLTDPDKLNSGLRFEELAIAWFNVLRPFTNTQNGQILLVQKVSFFYGTAVNNVYSAIQDLTAQNISIEKSIFEKYLLMLGNYLSLNNLIGKIDRNNEAYQSLQKITDIIIEKHGTTYVKDLYINAIEELRAKEIFAGAYCLYVQEFITTEFAQQKANYLANKEAAEAEFKLYIDQALKECAKILPVIIQARDADLIASIRQTISGLNESKIEIELKSQKLLEDDNSQLSVPANPPKPLTPFHQMYDSRAVQPVTPPGNSTMKHRRRADAADPKDKATKPRNNSV